MEIHYNAFISYRHHPDDIRVAADIHRSLEHFRVPYNIREKTGEIKRLFRDKEELPITSNLTDDIDAALKNSDWLIVICSVHTKESVWVQREIELFLQTHPKNRILTVLASGEPYDVIPEILLYDDVVDPVTGEITRKQVEPLSCDWRMKRRKAVQEELPRLAAAILGCSYDELRQRQRQYRARRNMIIVSTSLAASMCLTAYFLYTSITIQKANEEIKKANEEIIAANIQIQENLDESLINQSRHLATASQERLNDGDRLTAIALAMAALPSEDNPRPLVPEAENVLISALALYSTEDHPTAIGTVSPGMNIAIKDFWLTESEKVLYTYDQRDIVMSWDTDSLQKIGEISLDGFLLDSYLTLPDDHTVLITDRNMKCFRPDGSMVWELDNCRDAVYMAHDDTILAIHIAENMNSELVRVSASTGEIVGAAIDLTLKDPELYPASFICESLPAGFPAVIRFTSMNDGQLWCFDLETGEKKQIQAESTFPKQAVATQDGKLLMLFDEYTPALRGFFESNRINGEGTSVLCCFDISSGRQVWKKELSSSVSGMDLLREIPNSDRILCLNGNVFTVLEKSNGAVVSTSDVGSGVIAADVREEYTMAVLQDGYICNYWYDDNYSFEIKCMKNDVAKAAVGNSLYSLHRSGDHITIYRYLERDPDWSVSLDGLFTPRNKKVHGKYLAFQDYSWLYLFDTEKRELVWKNELGSNNLLGFSQDGTKLWYAEGNETLFTLDIASGRVTSEVIPVNADNSSASVRGVVFQDDECLYYVVGQIEKPIAVSWNLLTGETRTCELSLEGEDCAYWSWEPLAANGDYLWLWGHSKVLLEVNFETGKADFVADTSSAKPFVAVSESGRKAAITDQGMIYLKNPGLSTFDTIMLENANVRFVHFAGNTLFALCDNGFVYRLDMFGNILSQTKLNVQSGFGNNLMSSYVDFANVSWHFIADQKLVLNALGMGHVIDCETWTVGAVIPDFLLYNENTGHLICRRMQNIAGFKVYETSELLEMAEAELKGYQLSQEQKVSYGID